MKTSRPATSRASRARRTPAELISSNASSSSTPRQLAPVRAEGVRLDQLGARGDVARVHRRRRSRARGGSPPPGSAGRRRRPRAARPSRRPRRSAGPCGGARGTGSRLATVPGMVEAGPPPGPASDHEWPPRKREPAPPRARRVRWPVRTIGATRPSIITRMGHSRRETRECRCPDAPTAACPVSAFQSGHTLFAAQYGSGRQLPPASRSAGRGMIAVSSRPGILLSSAAGSRT